MLDMECIALKKFHPPCMSRFELVLPIYELQCLMVGVENELLGNEVMSPMPKNSYNYIELFFICSVVLMQI
jgi:hypothetical protein